MIDATRIIREYLITSVSAAASTTLSAGMDADDTSFTVVSGAAFANLDAPLVLQIDSELMLATRSGNTITVDLGGRGALGSTAASHSNGATVSLANLYIVAGTRVYADKLPVDFANTSPSVLFRIRGGAGPAVLVPVTELSAEFFCYGGTNNYDDSAALGRLLNDRLHDTTMASTTSGVLMHAHEEVQMQNATEPDTEYPRTFTAYGIGLRSF